MVDSKASKKKGPKYSYRLRVTENFISSYVNLSGDDREFVEGFLALEVYGNAGMGHYTPSPNRRRAESLDQHVLSEYVRGTIHDPWSKWAKMITKANLTEFERREAVREMLGALISQRNKSHLNDSELRDASEKALDWTRWDEHNCALSRLTNSSEYEDCMKAIASRKNIKTVMKQYPAVFRKLEILQ